MHCCACCASCARDEHNCAFIIGVTRKSDSLPTDLAAAHAIIIAQRDALLAAEARATAAESEAKSARC